VKKLSIEERLKQNVGWWVDLPVASGGKVYGQVVSVDSDSVWLESDGNRYHVPFGNIQNDNLIFTREKIRGKQ